MFKTRCAASEQVKLQEYEEYQILRRMAKKKCGECRERFYEKEIERMELHFEQNDMHNFFKGIDAMAGVARNKSTINSTGLWEYGVNGEKTLVTEKEKIMKVWTDYFKQLLNQQSVVGSEVEKTLREQEEEQTKYDETLTMEELVYAIKKIEIKESNGTVRDSD